MGDRPGSFPVPTAEKPRGPGYTARTERYSLLRVFSGLQVALMKEWKGVVSITLHSALSPACSDAAWELVGKRTRGPCPHLLNRALPGDQWVCSEAREVLVESRGWYTLSVMAGR